MHEIHEQLLEIIKKQLLTSLFQPIVSLRENNIYAYEALIRGPSDSPLHSPINLFSMAERYNETAALEKACRKVSIQQFVDQKVASKLFLNVSPTVLLDPEFKGGETLAFLEQVGIPPSQIVIEITEHQPTDNYEIMRDAVSHYRSMGFEIALDDLGEGYSGLRLWTELLPDYVKIDRHFIQNIDKDPVKLNFVRSIQSMATASNCRIIAEGVETEAEYLAAESLGISFSQGYYFARPTPKVISTIVPELFSREKVEEKVVAFKTTTRISEIMQEATAISAQTSNNEVLSLFQKNTDLNVMPVVDDGIASGLLYKEQFLTKLFASRFGIDLYGKKAVAMFVDTKPFAFDQQLVIEEVSRQLTNTKHSDQTFIITENGRYRGLGVVMDLLKLITTQQLQNAQHANPLTLLPGVTPINHIINSLILDNTRFAIGYFDLDHFKPFNDIYGYEKGDQAIKLVAELLTNYVEEQAGYIGHIGGDDFIVIFKTQDWENSCKKILLAFEQAVTKLYKEEHLLAGGITAIDRTGSTCFYPVLSLSIGIVAANAIMQCQSHIEVSDLAAEAKHHAKTMKGNSYFINRRVIINESSEPRRMGLYSVA